jgi:ribA/ribD-fused uncharacterized protein
MLTEYPKRSETSGSTDRLMRTYVRAKVVVFHKTKDEFGGLSNMAAGFDLRVNNVSILTAEALYQACRFPHCPGIQQEIIDQRSPMTAKMKSKANRKETRADWEQVRSKVMRWCLRVKLAQNYEQFGQLLLSTGDRPIVELSRKDNYWGAKLTNNSGDILIGQNVLGRLLMELREKLKADDGRVLRSALPIDIPEFHLLGKPIEMVAAEPESSDNQIQNALF